MEGTIWNKREIIIHTIIICSPNPSILHEADRLPKYTLHPMMGKVGQPEDLGDIFLTYLSVGCLAGNGSPQIYNSIFASAHPRRSSDVSGNENRNSIWCALLSNGIQFLPLLKSTLPTNHFICHLTSAGVHKRSVTICSSRPIVTVRCFFDAAREWQISTAISPGCIQAALLSLNIGPPYPLTGDLWI